MARRAVCSRCTPSSRARVAAWSSAAPGLRSSVNRSSTTLVTKKRSAPARCRTISPHVISPGRGAQANSATEAIIVGAAAGARSDRERPAIGVRGLAVLDGHDGVVELLGERSDLAPVDHHLLALVGQLAHRRDHRSEEHTSELQSHLNLVCRLLLEKK